MLIRTLLIGITLIATSVAGCQSRFQAVSRNLPLGEDVIPAPTLCRKAKLSEDVRVVALANKYCAEQNISKLKDARINYDKLRVCYATGACND